jgi:hypothetical protein
LGLSKCSKCKNIKKYEIKQEIRVFILNFGDYCLFYAVLDYSSLLFGIEEI